MRAMDALTIEEQEMAEQYFPLVDKFLRCKRLDPNEYFDVVIFGYLQAIQCECRNLNPPENKNIYGLIEVCMKRAVLQEWRRQRRYMRQGDYENCSLDRMAADTDDGEFSLYDVVADVRQRPDVQIEAKDLTERILAVATPREREMIDLACVGYETREIADTLGVSRNTASRILCNFRVKAKAVRDDREVIRTPGAEKNREKIHARDRVWREAHKAEIAAKQKDPAVRQKRNEYKRRYRTAHPEEVRAKERAYREAHKDEINARERARRAAKRAMQQAQAQEKCRPQCSEHQERQVAVTV